MSLLNDVVSIDKAPVNRFTVILGKPGSGKTTICGTFPKPILFVSLEQDGGAEILREYGDDVKLLCIDNDPITKQNSQHIQTKLMNLVNELKTVKHPYKTIVFDPYSSVEESLVKRFETIKNSKLSMQERGIIGSLMITLRDNIVELSQMGVECVLPTHIKVDEENVDTATGEVNPQIIPKMTKNNGRMLLEKASNVMYCCKKSVNENGIRKVKFLTYLGAHPNMDTKIRLNKDLLKEAGIYVENCTYDKIEELKSGKVKTEEIKTDNVMENPFEKLKEEEDE